MSSHARLKVAVVGTGISGLSAAWLLHPRHDVTIYEKARRIGGHSNTVSATIGGAEIAVDTGFIVFNPATYPNFVELLRVLGVESCVSDMSFAVSLDAGRIEYSGSGLAGLFSQTSNLVRPRFWGMLADLVRFYRRATRDAPGSGLGQASLGEYLDAGRYGAAFRDHHILPMASAIWSAAPTDILDYPAEAFLRFYDNHGLLRLTGRPIWRTVVGGSREYVARLAAPLAAHIRAAAGAVSIERIGGRVVVADAAGTRDAFDRVVVATHADEALALLANPSADERALLGAFRYSRNEAWLHLDETFMPRRRAVWASWNHVAGGDSRDRTSVTYWMNSLQKLRDRRQRVRHPEPPVVGRETCCGSRAMTIRSSTPQRCAPRSVCGACRGQAASGSAARISGPASTRTGCSLGSRSQSSSAGCGGHGGSRANRRAS